MSNHIKSTINKQSSIDWLVEQLPDTIQNYFLQDIEIAKKMEKEQIKEAWNDGNLLGRNGFVIEEYSNGETFFNHTYRQ